MDFSIRELTAAYKAGTLTPADVITEAYRRIAARSKDPVWITLAAEEVSLAKAVALGSYDPKLPLYGIPFAVKDNIDVAGMPTTAGCPAFQYEPADSAFVIERLIAAGAIPIGKTNMDQFATGLVGTRSPYGACSSEFGEDYISGGSSSGSAVAVAAEFVSFSLGTDTAGSGRVPAAFNNLVGLKPTRGVFSGSGLVPACRTLDCISVFTNTAEDARRVFEVMRGYDPADAYSRQPGQAVAWPKRFRFGVPSKDMLQFFGDTGAGELYWAAVSKLQEAGHECVEVDYAIFRDAANLLYSGPWVAERYAAIESFLEQHEADLYPVTAKIITGARKISAADTFSAVYKLAALARRAEAEWQKMDVLLLPTTGTIYTHEQVAAEPVALNTNLGYYTNFVNLLDLAAIAVPAGFRANGLPFGVTFIAPAWSDEALLDTAQSFLAEAVDTYCPPGYVPLAVCGAHLSGMPLNWQLTQAGAYLIEATATPPNYKLYALAGTVPPKPGLFRADEGGAAIEVEVWAVPESTFGRFVANVPPPLAIGSCTLQSGRTVKSFVCEPAGLAGAEDITALGGWRAYIKRGPRQ